MGIETGGFTPEEQKWIDAGDKVGELSSKLAGAASSEEKRQILMAEAGIDQETAFMVQGELLGKNSEEQFEILKKALNGEYGSGQEQQKAA